MLLMVASKISLRLLWWRPTEHQCVLIYRCVFTHACCWLFSVGNKVSTTTTFIFPYLMYCNQIWGSTYKLDLRKPQVLQNKAVRIITGSSRKTSIDWMYNEYRILRLYEINLYLLGKFMLKAFHEDVPNVFDNFFTYDYTIHEHNTRSAQHLHTPLCVSNLTKTGIRYQGPIIWNNILKADINPMCSEASFTIMLKKCLLNQIIKVWIMS